MNCDLVDRENIIERYLAGELAPDVKEAWEEHYFGCERCSQQLETWCAIEKPLRAIDADIRAEIQVESVKRKPAPLATRWLWPAAAVVVALLVGVAAWFGISQRTGVKPEVASQSMPDLAELARVDPPAYSVSTMRGADTKAESQFLEAMKFYQAHDYPRAIAGLEDAVKADPDAAPSRFFLGACYLLTGRSSAAVAELRKVAAGDSPFREEAQFYLAKAYLSEGKAADAITVLRPLAGTQSEFSQEASRLIGRLSPVR